MLGGSSNVGKTIGHHQVEYATRRYYSIESMRCITRNYYDQIYRRLQQLCNNNDDAVSGGGNIIHETHQKQYTLYRKSIQMAQDNFQIISYPNTNEVEYIKKVISEEKQDVLYHVNAVTTVTLHNTALLMDEMGKGCLDSGSGNTTIMNKEDDDDDTDDEYIVGEKFPIFLFPILYQQYDEIYTNTLINPIISMQKEEIYIYMEYNNQILCLTLGINNKVYYHIKYSIMYSHPNKPSNVEYNLALQTMLKCIVYVEECRDLEIQVSFIPIHKIIEHTSKKSCRKIVQSTAISMSSPSTTTSVSTTTENVNKILGQSILFTILPTHFFFNGLAENPFIKHNLTTNVTIFGYAKVVAETPSQTTIYLVDIFKYVLHNQILEETYTSTVLNGEHFISTYASRKILDSIPITRTTMSYDDDDVGSGGGVVVAQHHHEYMIIPLNQTTNRLGFKMQVDGIIEIKNENTLSVGYKNHPRINLYFRMDDPKHLYTLDFVKIDEIYCDSEFPFSKIADTHFMVDRITFIVVQCEIIQNRLYYLNVCNNTKTNVCTSENLKKLIN